MDEKKANTNCLIPIYLDIREILINKLRALRSYAFFKRVTKNGSK